MVRKLLRWRRAVSPIVADLLMVVITVAAFGLTMMSTNQWISLQRTNQMQMIKERLLLEDAWFISGGKVNLTVTNIGLIELKVQWVQINRDAVWEGSFSLDIGETKHFVVNLSWSANEEYVITIITDRGNQFEAVFVSPS